MAKEHGGGAVSGAFVLTPAAGKKLIGKAVAALPEVQRAFTGGRLLVANGTTTGYIVEALTGKPVNHFQYCVGVVAQGKFTENPASDHTLLYWEKGEMRNLPFKDFL